MENAGEVLRNFYAAVVKRDLAAARACLADDMVFEGLFQTYRSADEYMKTFAGLLQITVRLDISVAPSRNSIAMKYCSPCLPIS
jgi:ketosteroid isomerase-like protein